jgi:hypothetical protein
VTVETTAEQRIADLLEKAYQLETKLAHFEWEKEQWQSAHPDATASPQWMIDKDMDLRPPFAEVLRQLWLHAANLIGMKGSSSYLQIFYQRLGNPFEEWKAASSFGDDPERYTPGPYNLSLAEFRDVLAPYSIEPTSQEQYRVQQGLLYLERLLENTAILVKLRGIAPAKETDLNNIVEEFLFVLFPKARAADRSQFNTVFKTFRPDILIPEMSTAIEYKFVDSEADLKKVLGEIAEDAKGYGTHDHYSNFYAVFYLTQLFCSRERFEEAWTEFGAPKTWHPIYCVAGPP